jgi:hypothetical protein
MRPRSKLAGIAAVAAAALAPAPAHAGIGQPVQTPDTVKQQTITALEYQGGDRLWIGTSRYVYKRSGAGWDKQIDSVGSNFTAIAFNSSGTNGIAVGKAGVLWRYDAGGWKKQASPMTYNFRFEDCFSPGSYTLSSPVVEDFTGVRWTDDSTVYLFSKRYGSLLRSTDKGAKWAEVNRQSNGSCYYNGSANDIFVLPGSSPAYMLIHTGRIFLSTSGLTTFASDRGGACGNRLVVDPQNPARMYAGGPGCWEFSFSEDGGSSFRQARLMNGREQQYATFAGRGSTMLGAGDAGYIFNAITPGEAYLEPADGALLTNDWRASALASESVGALGGANGSLVVSKQLNTVPDIVKPTGSIGGPTSGTTGATLTFSADVSDNDGGSGIDSGGLTWKSDEAAAGSGSTAAITFPRAGYYTIELTFRDRQGNTATATKGVSISDPPAVYDSTDPKGTISGPAYAVAGAPATFTVAASDNVAVDPSSFRWSTDDAYAGSSKTTVAITFEQPGENRVFVSFSDTSGNDGSASMDVPVAPKPEDRPKPTTAPGTTKPTIKKGKGGKFTIPIKGGYTLPKGVTADLGCKGEVLFTMKKAKTLISARSTALSKSCRYKKSFSIAKGKVGAAKTVAITIRFPGNAWLAPVKKTYTVAVPKG